MPIGKAMRVAKIDRAVRQIDRADWIEALVADTCEQRGLDVGSRGGIQARAADGRCRGIGDGVAGVRAQCLHIEVIALGDAPV